MKIVFDDPIFSFQLLRVIGSAYYGGADIGECLSTAYKIKEKDFESWYNEWLKTADRVSKYGDQCLSSGHKISALDSYLRASNYYRTAEFFLHENPADPRISETWEKSVKMFQKAANLFSHHFEQVEIPYNENSISSNSLPGYFYMPNEDSNSSTSKNSTRPTLILFTGFDGTQEELYTTSVVPALQRGYNCLTFEGPGQGRVIRKQHIHFRYDWENVITPVLDFILTKKRELVDPKRIAVMGISLGGFLAARAAAFEHRISACILDDGVYDIYQTFLNRFNWSRNQIEKEDPLILNTILETSMYFNTTIRWALSHGMWTFGAKTPFEFIQKNRNYTLKDISQNIKCPTLVLEAEKDDSFPGQPKLVYESLKCSKHYILFTTEEGAEDHCQIGALARSNQQIFDWLDKTLEI